MDRTCGNCGAGIMLARADARYCSTRCRVAARRARLRSPIPAALRDRDRWIRWRPEARRDAATKAPRLIDGTGYASSTNESTWSTYRAAAESNHGTGLGFVLNGDGIACVDLDGVIVDGALDPRAEALLAELGPFYVEASPSGAGIHAWVYGNSPAGHPVYIRPDGLKVEWYSAGRYMTVTGKPM